MKKTAVLGLLTYAAAMSAMQYEEIIITESKPTTSKPPVKPNVLLRPFKEEEGIKRLISDYKDVMNGICKKGPRKQALVIVKINEFLEKGLLTREHLLLTKNLTQCMADEGGDCEHPQCPQCLDNEPEATGRICPLPFISHRENVNF